MMVNQGTGTFSGVDFSSNSASYYVSESCVCECVYMCLCVYVCIFVFMCVCVFMWLGGWATEVNS